MHDNLTSPSDGGFWLSVSQLAKRNGVSRQSMAERVNRLLAEGLVTVRRDGHLKLINVAQFDRAVGNVGIPSRESSALTKSETSGHSASSAFRDAATREKEYAADIKYLEREERLGRLLPVSDLASAAASVCELIVREIDHLPVHADSIAAAVGKDGPAGAKATLKEIAHEIRKSIAEAMASLGRTARPAEIDTSLPASRNDEVEE